MLTNPEITIQIERQIEVCRFEGIAFYLWIICAKENLETWFY